jgi:hypothetical protein
MRCKLLENQICIRSDGQYRLCCISTEESNVETIKTHTIENWIDSKTHTNARQDFVNNKWPAACSKCQQQEETGVSSKRQLATDYGPGITHLDIRFGNNCNLGCSMCWPGSSSTLVYEHQKLLDNKIESPWGTVPFKVLNWYEDQYAEMLSSIPTLKEVYLTGGEPMMAKGLIHFIRLLDSSITLRFNTNGTILNPNLITELRRFKQVNMSFSIDGFGPVNNYIRWGSDWDTICKNLKTCQDAGFDVSISPTIQILNELYIVQLKTWAINNNLKVFDNFLVNPSYHNVENAKWHGGDKTMQEIFIKNIKILDSSRNCNIRDYLPEVARAYGIN